MENPGEIHLRGKDGKLCIVYEIFLADFENACKNLFEKSKLYPDIDLKQGKAVLSVSNLLENESP